MARKKIKFKNTRIREMSCRAGAHHTISTGFNLNFSANEFEKIYLYSTFEFERYRYITN